MGFISFMKKSASMVRVGKSSVQAFEGPAQDEEKPQSKPKQQRLTRSDCQELDTTPATGKPQLLKGRPGPPTLQLPSPVAKEASPKSTGTASLQSVGPKKVQAPAMPTVEVNKSPEKVAAAAPTPGARAAAAPEAAAEAPPLPPMVELAEQDQATLSFSIPQEELWHKVSSEFGHMIASSLQASKWDKRVQALKSVAQVLKGLGLGPMSEPGSTGFLGKGLKLRDRVECWRTACQLLHLLLRDKVMPVRLASHELFMDVFANAEGLVTKREIHFALGVLIDPLIDRLGDHNLRLHESARLCVVFCAEHPGLFGVGAVLARLQARLVAPGKIGERAKAHFGVLDAVGQLLKKFPGRRDDDDDDDDEDLVARSVSSKVMNVFGAVLLSLLAGSAFMLYTGRKSCCSLTAAQQPLVTA
eukprot:gnl/TRDRNA2_/TRDRNA2_170572_c1_seq1.p1 gnl/TRDRNA2_/TRDRNA2_170572_c1~~gnl/TRDRNA2_/TRDRNA2_170572_c1_seq1.p1  ORF type:complete len:415 (-),score=97.04 gnl/TRDRNA2_/TRDRNA2_170572_c1_seq1:362-1606(-)